MNNEFEKINKTILNAKQERTKQHDEITKTINEKTEAIKKADQLMLDATANCDLKAFKQAKNEKENAKDERNIYIAQLDYINKMSLLTEDEGMEIANRIKSIQNNMLDNFKAEIKPHLEAIYELSRSAFNEIEEGDSLKRNWMKDIIQFKRMVGTKNGEPVYMEVVDSADGYLNCMCFVNSILRDPECIDIIGAKIEGERINILGDME